MRIKVLCGLLSLAALCACGGGSSSNTTPAATPAPAAPTPGPLTWSPSPLTVSVTGANGIPQTATETLSQTGLTSAPKSGSGSGTCFSFQNPGPNDYLAVIGTGGAGYNASNGTINSTLQLLAKKPGRCTVIVTLGASTATLNVTVNP